MKFTTLIFDMDGVVIDSEVLFRHANEEFFARHNKTCASEEVALLLTGMSLRDGTKLLKEKYDLQGTVDEIMQQRQELLTIQYRTRLSYISGFEKFYDQVVSAGLKTCIATSSNDYLLGLATAKVGLDKKFGSNIFKASDVGNASKPDPAIYLYAAKQMGSNPANCFAIEDSPKGVQAAKNAGIFCIGITNTFNRDKLSHADLVVDSYEEIELDQLI